MQNINKHDNDANDANDVDVHNVQQCLNIDLQWSTTQKWWDEISDDHNNELFPPIYNTISSEEKEIFSIKVQYIIKNIRNR